MTSDYSHHGLNLVQAWASGDPHRFQAAGLQLAANLARSGEGDAARKVRDAVDKAYLSKSYLPKFSGARVYCAKCEFGIVSIKYMREDQVEFLERECDRCGHVWYEKCADAG